MWLDLNLVVQPGQEIFEYLLAVYYYFYSIVDLGPILSVITHPLHLLHMTLREVAFACQPRVGYFV